MPLRKSGTQSVNPWQSSKPKRAVLRQQAHASVAEPKIKSEAENDSEESENFQKRHKHQIWLQQRKNHQNWRQVIWNYPGKGTTKTRKEVEESEENYMTYRMPVTQSVFKLWQSQEEHSRGKEKKAFLKK